MKATTEHGKAIDAASFLLATGIYYKHKSKRTFSTFCTPDGSQSLGNSSVIKVPTLHVCVRVCVCVCVCVCV